MRIPLFDFQEKALTQLHAKLNQARSWASTDNPQTVSFAAPTGSGKTIVMTALFEDIFFGEPGFPPQPDATILWISDMPELNEQTRRKIESKSDRIRTQQLITIESEFDSERLKPGCVHFVNTQKLGSDKKLTRKGDDRQYTLWETLTNTARNNTGDFYVVIDEAHRGMLRTDRETKTAQSILQKFLLGSSEDGLCPMPLVIGMTATPERFETLLSGPLHTLHKVHVLADEVRESGLLKERILIHYPDKDSLSEMTLLTEAASRWQEMQNSWSNYCTSEGLEPVRPILVIQVEDGSGDIITRTSLSTVLHTLESAVGRPFRLGEVRHAFNDTGELSIGEYKIQHIEASRIAEDEIVNVVLFKMNLSTGWDCPRAEVMMSFRRAQDHTYIAQLLGRMVRTPLARRVEKDAALNDVHLYLPHYDEVTVNAVIEDLKDVENVPPTDTGTPKELVILEKRSGTERIFEAMEDLDLVTYRVNAVRKQKALRRLMGIGRGLTQDRIDDESQEQITQEIVRWMSGELQRIQASEGYEQYIKNLMGVDVRTITVSGTKVTKAEVVYTVDAAAADIDRHFAQSGRVLSNGLHIAYWKANPDRDAAEVKVEVVALTQDRDAMESLDRRADREFNRLYEEHKRQIAKLTEQRRRHYETLRLAAAQPEPISWILPDSINFRRAADDPTREKHLYLESDNTFRTKLGTWEAGVLKEEVADLDVVAWLRNVDRQKWSLEIPYRDGGEIKSMFPDLIIVRRAGDDLVFDVLEPHNPNLTDNPAKAVGLAEFAEKHWDLFGRIQLIRQEKRANGIFYLRLDVSNDAIRKQVLAVQNDTELDRIFKDHAGTRA